MAERAPGLGGMTDLDMVKDYLITCKHVTEQYNHAAQESTNPGVRELFLQIHGQEQHDQEVAFSFLAVRGGYPVNFPSRDRLESERRRWQQVAAAMPEDVGRSGAGKETQGRGPTPGATAGPGTPNARENPPRPDTSGSRIQ